MSVEEKMRHYVRGYEEVMLLDYSAALFREHARDGKLTLDQLHDFLSFPSHAASAKVFSMFDEDGSGTIDANEFHKIVRYLNFGSGYCDGCDAPVLQNQHSFYCTVCNDYLLCRSCYGQRAALHTPSHQFRLTCDKPALEEHMPGLGNFLRAEIDTLFKELDVDGSGQVSHGEFRYYFRDKGFPDALIDHFLHFDLDGDGYLSKKELVCIVTAMRITRFCDECGDWEFPGSDDMLSCVECTADYDVCRACFESRRCSHDHAHYETVSMFQLRRLGLCLEIDGNDRRLICEDHDKWSLYKPFFDLDVGSHRPSGETWTGAKTGNAKPTSQGRALTDSKLAAAAATGLVKGVASGSGKVLGRELMRNLLQVGVDNDSPTDGADFGVDSGDFDDGGGLDGLVDVLGDLLSSLF